MAGAHKNPLFRIVRAVGEAFTALGVQSPHFDPYFDTLE
jgi:hypothetical protein